MDFIKNLDIAHIIAGVGVVVAGCIFVGSLYNIDNSSREYRKNYEVLYQNVKQKADVNKDWHVDGHEWISVYDKLGIEFDALHPYQLTAQDMQKYLEIK